jgi:hypothetical protein
MKETIEDLLNKKAEQSSRVDLNAYANGLDDGAKWQAERMYSEEEVLKLVDGAFRMYASSHRHDAKEWLVEQFKKK